MKDSDKIKNFLIDEFYNEVQEKVDKNLKDSDDYTEFKNTLNCTLKKIDVLNEDIYDIKIDTLSIIVQGDFIRENKKAKKEFIMFILFSFIIISLNAVTMIVTIIKTGPKILIISQMLIIILTPWIIIPSIAIKRKRSEV